jgi:hypothetical protein
VTVLSGFLWDLFLLWFLIVMVLVNPITGSRFFFRHLLMNRKIQAVRLRRRFHEEMRSMFHSNFLLTATAKETLTTLPVASCSISCWVSFVSSSGEFCHSSSPFFNQAGSFHHSCDSTSASAGAPRKARLAGFSTPGQCLHQLGLENFRIDSTWFWTKNFHRFGSPRIHPSVTRESDQ